jgi:hypothetical protein
MSSGRSLRLLWRHPYVFAAAVLLFASGLAAGGTTLASFTAETENATATFSGGWIGTASNPTVAPSGYDGQLAWTPGQHGPVTGQQLWGYDDGASSTCPASGYTQLAAMASATTDTYTDPHSTNALNGHYYCYEMVSTSAGGWTATGSFPATQLGLVATGASITNHGTAGYVDVTDVITITFNQQTNYPTTSQTVRVCAFTAGVVILGDTSGGCNGTGDAYSIGRLALSSGSLAGNQTYASSTAIASTSAPWTITVTLAGAGAADQKNGAGSWSLTPSTSVRSQAATHQATACTNATYNCTPTETGGF